MSKKKPLSITAIDLADAATSRLSAWRKTLMLLAANGMSETRESDPLGQELRAAAAVATMAEMERLLRELVVSTADEVNTAAVQLRKLVPELRGLAMQNHFQAIAASSKSDQHWEGRQFVTRLETSEEVTRLPTRNASGPQPPLDGRTIRSLHVYRLWVTLGLPDDAFPSADAEASLNALASIRNDVAHGNALLSEIFHPQVPGKSATDIETHIRNVERLIDHIGLAFHEYGRLRLYETA